MNKKLATPIVVLLVGFALTAVIRPAQAGVIGTPTWISPVWHNKTDAFLGTVGDAYITGEEWMLNIWVRNEEYNSTTPPRETVSVTVKNISIWFDWNKFYNTSVDVTIKYGDSYLFTVKGVTENTTIASNLFTHSYKVYIEYQYPTLIDGSVATRYGVWTWTPTTTFAVLTTEQYEAEQAYRKYIALEDSVDSYVDEYAESLALYVEAEMKANDAATAYKEGNFGSAKTLYNEAINLLNQAMSAYETNEKAFEKAELDMAQGEADAAKNNATATLIEANGLANAMIINAVAFVFFGLGFIIFGIAAIYYAKRPKPA